MKKRILVGIACSAIILGIYSCLDPYTPAAITDDVNYLVVNGFLNTTEKSCTIMLNRTVPVNSKISTKIETGATVALEDEIGNQIILIESTAGIYSGTNIPVNDIKEYRLTIMTTDKSEYVSERVPLLKTPPLDYVNWAPEDTGIPIYIGTHDDGNKTRYYSWKYVETWMYTAPFDSILKIVDDKIVPRQSLRTCWSTKASTATIVYSSATLDKDIISQFKLTTIPWTSEKISSKYSILVSQRALTKQAYDYYVQLKKNNENLGTLFDPLPSRITGNIQCITNPANLALGYFTASEVQSKRMYIASRDINRPPGAPRSITGFEDCREDTVRFNKPLYGKVATRYWTIEVSPIGYYTTEPSCIDCRSMGGVLTKPDFWE